MKIKLILLIFLSVSSLLHSQVNEKLDLKNGFRHFKLGSAHSQIKDIVREENETEITQNSALKMYNYVGTDIKTLAEVPISSISLIFFKEKLLSINLNFGSKYEEFEESQFNDILYYLEEIYGDWKRPIDSNNNITNGVVFKGKKVTFEFFRMEYPKGTNKFRGYIHIYDNNIQKSLLESQL